MAKKSDLKKTIEKTIEQKIKNFIRMVKIQGIPLTSVFVFGSQVTGKKHLGSDIDVCLVSPSFSDRFRDRLNLMRLRRSIDLAIEPHPFNPSEFVDENPLVWEIKKTGIRVL